MTTHPTIAAGRFLFGLAMALLMICSGADAALPDAAFASTTPADAPTTTAPEVRQALENTLTDKKPAGYSYDDGLLLAELEKSVPIADLASLTKPRVSFQGLWHDPTTGLAYARNRWYDARTASWLSEDPLGPVDSPNLYAFVAWGPHAARDPLGKQGGAFFAVMMADNIIDGGRAEAVDTWNGLVDMAEGIPAWLRDDAKAERLEAYEEGGYEAYKAVLERQSGMTAEQLLSLVPFRRAGLLLKDLPRKFREEGPVAVEQAIGRALFSGGTDAAGVYGTYKVIAGPKAAPNPTVAWAERMSRVPGDEIPSSGLGKFDGFGDVKTSPWLRDPRLAVRSHIEDFRQGGSFLVPESLYRRFVEGQAVVGRESGLFITTRGAMDKLIAETGGDLAAISKRLGTTWSEPLYRVDVHNPLLHNARLPSGLEAGADPLLFRWGGYTSGGMPELAVDPVPAGGFSATRVP
jgi:RHS repeat-associated protein